MPLLVWGAESSSEQQQLTGAGDDVASFRILDDTTVRAIRATGSASISLADDVLSLDVAALTAAGDDEASYKVLDGSQVRALQGVGGTQISLQPAGVLSINTPVQVTGFGDGSTNGFRLLHASQIVSLKGGQYVQVLAEGTNSVVVRGNTELQNALDSKANRSGAVFTGNVDVPSGLSILPSAPPSAVSEIALYRYADKSGINETGAIWRIGRGANGVAANAFSIGGSVIGSVLSIANGGPATFNYALSAPSRTAGGSAVLTTASSIPIGNVANLQGDLNGKANTSGATFTGLVVVPDTSGVVPTTPGGMSRYVWYKYADRSGLATEQSSQWALGIGAHGSGPTILQLAAIY